MPDNEEIKIPIVKCGHCGKKIKAFCPRPIGPDYLCKDCNPLFKEQFDDFIEEYAENQFKSMFWSPSIYWKKRKKHKD